MSSRAATVLLAATLFVACRAGETDAQELRTLTSARAHAGEESLRVDVTYAAGRMTIHPGAPGSLYRAQLQFDDRYMTPIAEYTTGRLRIGIEGEVRLRGRSRRVPSTLDLALTPDIPIDLKVEFGAAEARMDLGGMRLRGLRVATGASDTELTFSMPNQERMGELQIEAGAAAIRVRQLGNANVERLRVSGGVGDVHLDFSGDWRSSMQAHISMGVGALRLVLPRGVGVEVRRSGFLASFDGQELERRGDHYYSRDWDSAPHRLSIQIDAAFGKTDVRWTD
jgi:hypothetical protein